MTIRSFDLLQPRSLQEAVELLQKHGDDSRVIAGGTTLVILMKQRALHYRYLIDLQSIPGLTGIKNENDGVRIGALATHRMVETSPLIRQAFPAVSRAFGHIGNVRVRQTASVGGNLAHADYRLDPPPALLALNAEVNVFGPQGARTVPIKNFFQGMYETALAPGEILVDVKIPFHAGKQPGGLPALHRAIGKRLAVLGSGRISCKTKRALQRIARRARRRGGNAGIDRRFGIRQRSNPRPGSDRSAPGIGRSTNFALLRLARFGMVQTAHGAAIRAKSALNS